MTVLIGENILTSSNVQQDTLDTVDVFDVGSISAQNPDGMWYSQKTSGPIPAPRVDPCVVAIAAPDNSSYNVYALLHFGLRNTMLTDIAATCMVGAMA